MGGQDGWAWRGVQGVDFIGAISYVMLIDRESVRNEHGN